MKLCKSCRLCGQEFETYPSHDNDYCSYDCAFNARIRKVEKRCAYCGSTFLCKRSETEIICCSWDCRVKRLHARMHPRKPKYWTQRRKQILERDGWTCQKCKFLSPSGRSLQVHHKIHKKDGGTEELENLMVLC